MISPVLRKAMIALVLVGMMAGSVPRSAPAIVPSLVPDDAVLIDFDFDEPGLGTVPELTTVAVSDQYRDLGVIFDNAVAENYRDDLKNFPKSRPTAIHPCESAQIWNCTAPLTMTFTAPQRYVALYVGFNGSLPESVEVTLTAFDAGSGGAAIGQNSVKIGPNDAGVPYIPVNTLLEFTTTGPAIWRIQVGFSDDSDLSDDASITPNLIFDSVAFAPFLEEDPPAQSTDCPDNPTPPIVNSLQVTEPKKGLATALNAFIMKGNVTTESELFDATLSTTNGIDTHEQSILGKILSPGGGKFENTITHLLFPGSNRVTLTVSNCAGPTTAQADVTYAPSTGGTSITMLGLEVTQAIQDLDNSVPLIADKPTFVRVYLATTGSTDIFTDVTGSLRACRVPDEDTSPCSDLGSISSRNDITVDALDDLTAKRKKMHSALLFILPPEWTTAGGLNIWLDSTSLSPDLACEGCGNRQSALFLTVPPPTVNFVSVAFTQGEMVHVPADIDRVFLESWLRRAYPISDVVTDWTVGEINFTDGRPTCAAVSIEMFHQWAIAKANEGYEITPTRFYGLVPLLAKMTKDDAGCALVGTSDTADDLEKPYNDHYASGPAGTRVDYPWDDDDSFADFYGGHEIAHTFGRKHPGWCGGSGDDDKNPAADEFVDGLIGGKDERFMGFDAGDERYTSLPRRLYRGDRWHDVMSYCDYIWITSYAYEELITAVQTPTPTPTPSADTDGADVAIELALEVTEATPTAGQPAANEVLVVVGTINLDQGSVAFRPFTVVPGSFTTPDEQGEFSIVLKDGGNAPIGEPHVFQPREFIDVPGPDRIAMLGEVVPWDDTTESIEILQSGTPIATQTVSKNEPVVTITSPGATNRFQGSNIRVTWTAEDAADEELTYSLLYSANGGKTWQSIASGMPDIPRAADPRFRETEYDVDSRLLAGSDQAIFRVIATDGVLTGEDRTDTFTVEPNPPDVGIISPGDRTRFRRTETIVLVGTATDIGRGTLGDEALKWSADEGTPEQRDLGTGRSVSVTGLSPGRHTLTLTATSADGVSATSTVHVRVVEDAPPIVDLPNPISDADPTLGADPSLDGLFLYDNIEEVGAFYLNHGGGQMEPLRTFDVLLNGWSAIVPGRFSDSWSTDLLFYASDLGVGEFYASDGQGGLQLLSGNEGFTKGWDIIVPGDFDGQDDLTDLFFYDREEGIGKFYTTDGTGRIRLLGESVPLAHTWTSIVAGSFGGNGPSDLLFYDEATGVAQVFVTDGEGSLSPSGIAANLTAGWDQIVAGTFDDSVGTDIFLFDSETGNTAFSVVDGEDGLTLHAGMTLAAGWTSLLAGDFGGDSAFTDLFFYDSDGDRGMFFATDGDGTVRKLSRMDRIGAEWDLIVPGHFGTP